MKRSFAVGVVLLFVAALPAAADFSLVRSIPAPHGTQWLTGLDNANGALFAVASQGGQGSCMYLIDPVTGGLIREACPEGEPPGCPGSALQFVSCAFDPWIGLDGDPLCADTYWVGDACGDLIKYNWTGTHGLVYAGYCKPSGVSEPFGLAYRNGFDYILDHADAAIYKLTGCFGHLPDPTQLPDGLIDPSALAFYGDSWFVSDSNVDVVYEISQMGVLLETHLLEGFYPRTLRGMTFIGDELYVASDDSEILVYEFGPPGVEVEVPEGDDVVVEVIPEELEITFPTVVDSGSLYVHVSQIDNCAAPEGVELLPDFYEILTTAAFEYAAQIDIMTNQPLPDRVDPRKVRIFARPSGDCQPYMDITVAPIMFYPPEGDPVLRVHTRTLSEDDEFSWFVLGEDQRNPMDVIAMKFLYLEEAIDAVGGVPVDPIDEMLELLAQAQTAFDRHRYARASRLIDGIADIAEATTEIPHTYYPDTPGSNLGGRIMARAHTLSFSIRLLMEQSVFAEPLASPSDPYCSAGAGVGGLVVGPNPGNSTFRLSFSPGRAEEVGLRIYTVRGELVRSLVEGQSLAGPQTVVWDGTDARGVPVAAGTYFAVYSGGQRTVTRKLILQR